MNLAAVIILYFGLHGPVSGQLTPECSIAWGNGSDYAKDVARVSCPEETRDYWVTWRGVIINGKWGIVIHAAPSLITQKAKKLR